MSDFEKYIKLLDLPDDFDIADLKKAYREKVLQYHPDKAKNEAERVGYEALMKKLNEANEYLKKYLEDSEEDTENTENTEDTEDTEDSYDYSDEEYEDEYEEDYDETEYDETSNNENSSFGKEQEDERSFNYNDTSGYNQNGYNNNFAEKFYSNTSSTNTVDSNFKVFVIVITLIIAIVALIPKGSDNNRNYAEKNKLQQTTTNSQDIRKVDFEPYFREVNRRIKMNWEPPQTPYSVEVIVVFKIAKDGRLLSSQIKKSSGIKDIDTSALRAIEKTAPFRPLPPNYTGQSVDVQLTLNQNAYRNGEKVLPQTEKPIIKTYSKTNAPSTTAMKPSTSSIPKTTREPNWNMYLNELSYRLKQSWNDNSGLEYKQLTIRFTMNRSDNQQGYVSSPKIIESSGYPYIDHEAIVAINGISARYPMPQEFNGDSIDIEVIFPTMQCKIVNIK